MGDANYGDAENRLSIFAIRGAYDWVNAPDRSRLEGLLESCRSGAPDEPVKAPTDDLWRTLYGAVRAVRFTSGMLDAYFPAMTRIANELRRRLLAERAAALPSYQSPDEAQWYWEAVQSQAL